VAACSKHYVGDGGTTRGINENDTVASFHDLLSVHMPPYYSAVIQGVSTVMVSFSSWNGVKMHASRFLVTDFLKNRLRFRVRIYLLCYMIYLRNCKLIRIFSGFCNLGLARAGQDDEP
jgi:hypothetical protein